MRNIETIEIYTDNGRVNAKGIICINNKKINYDTKLSQKIIDNIRISDKKFNMSIEDDIKHEILLDIISKSI